MPARILLCFGLLEGFQDLIPNRNRISQRFQPRCITLEFVVAKVAVLRARSQNERIIGKRYSLPIDITNKDLSSLLVHPRNLSHYDGYIALVTQYASDRGRDLTGTEHGRCNLIQERLKQVVVGTINQDNAHRGVPKSLSGA